jgi:ATP-binding protein involved in chromosome partitioning
MINRDGVARVLAGRSDRVSGVTVKENEIGFVLDVGGLDLTAANELEAMLTTAVKALPSVAGVRVIRTAERGAAPAEPAKPHIGRVVAVASGKGGVGKSTVAANLAVALARMGHRTGLLDADIYGPSVPTLLGTHGRAGLVDNRIEVAEAFGIKALSMGMMTDPNKAIVWRGPMASSAMTQMIEQANWGDLDVLVIDMPPGTGDIQLTLAQKIKPAGAIVVSTPQDLALIDAKRAIAMFAETNVPVLGIVENMSTFVCPACGTASEIFGHGGAEETAAALGVPFLGHIPLTMAVRAASDAGTPPASGDGPEGEPYRAVARGVVTALRLGD